MPHSLAYLIASVNRVGMIDWPSRLWHTARMTDLEKAAQEFRAATAALDAARDRLAVAIVAAAKSGARQAEIVRATGYTRETVRRICRDAGLSATAE